MHRRRTALFLMAAALGALGRAEPAAPLHETPGRTVDFSAAVNWDFTRLQKLDAWQNTALVIRRTLTEWYPPQAHGVALENSDPQALRTFFTRLTKTAPREWSVIYLASHQSPDGLWQFPHDPPQSWASILPETPPRREPPRFLVIDACYAEAADSAVLIQGTGASGVLYASTRTEAVHELNFHQRFPIDLTRRYAAEAKWLREVLGAPWNGRVSFLGFIWLRTFLATGQAPENAAEWNAFFHRCEQLAQAFRQGRGGDLATTIHFVSPPAEAPAK